MLREVSLDPARTHFLGRISREQYLCALRVSACHVYLTYPFVLSWSLLEAMACGVPIVVSGTAPVREVIKDGETGQLVDFFDVERIAEAALDRLASPARARQMGRNARDFACNFSFAAGLKGYDELVMGCGRTEDALVQSLEATST